MTTPTPSRRGPFRTARRTAALSLAALAAALLFATAGCGGTGEAEESAPEASSPEVKTALVRTELPVQQDVEDVVSLSADLEPLRRAVLAAEVAGTVERMSVDRGDRIAAGQVLATIDTRALQQRVAEAEALSRQAEAQHQRAEALFERRSITKQQMLDAITNRDVARARLSSAQLDLEKSRVRAPWGGQVAETRVEVGDYVMPGQAVAEIVDVDRLKVVAPASASDVPYLEVGRPVVVRIDSFPGETFQGTVTRLGAELDPGARTLPVEAEIRDPQGRLKPGMMARMEVPRQTLEDVLLVPLEALVDLGEERALFVVEGNVARRRIVELGPVLEDRVVILRGLEPGEPVIVEGEQRVAEGQPVEEAS